MKKFFALLLCCLLLWSVCNAESLSMEELREKQAELRQKQAEIADMLADINNIIAQRTRDDECTVSGDSLGKIKDLFPDESVACYIRDKLRKFSIEQTVTQEELDSLTVFWPSDPYPAIYDLTGIGLLRNLKTLSCWNIPYRGRELPEELFTLTKLEKLSISCYYDIPLERIPDSIGNLTNLSYLDLGNTQITSLPDSIGNLIHLEELRLDNTKLEKLPDSICNLIRLEGLYLHETNLEKLPENIGNLQRLKKLNLSKTKLTTLPESIWSLKLEELDMSGTEIR